MSGDYSLGEIAAYLGGELRGEAETRIIGLSTLQSAEEGQLSFLANPKYVKYLSGSQAEAVLLTADNAKSFKGCCIVVRDPYLAYAQISAWFDTSQKKSPGVHATASIHTSATVADDVFIGPNVVVEANVDIESGCHLEANSFVGAGSRIGANGFVGANVSIYHDVKIGSGAIIHSGAVVGADGFGIAPKPDGGWQKIHQIGGVTIGDDVEIGACTTIDRGALEDTRLGNGVKLDNHVQIAHNAIVGDYTALAAYSGLAGSAEVGSNCILAGDVCVVGHIRVCDNVQITARTLVTKSITEPGSYSSGATPLMTTAEWRRNSVRIGQLDKIARTVSKLNKE